MTSQLLRRTASRVVLPAVRSSSQLANTITRCISLTSSTAASTRSSFHSSSSTPPHSDSPLASLTGPSKSTSLQRQIDLPKEANIVIIGGGVIGCSIAYHLAKLGAKNVYLLEKNALTHGCTWHAAGLLGQLRGTKNLTRMLQYSAECFSKLQADTGLDPEWKQVGSIRVASSMERWKEIKRSSSQAASFGFEMHLISPEEAGKLCPVLNTSDLIGAAWIPTDGHVEPTSLTNAFAEGARKGGVKILQGVEVVGMEDVKSDGNLFQRGRIKTLQVKLKNDPSGDSSKVHSITVAKVINCGGLWARKLGQILKTNVPTVNVEHQYLVTERITSGIGGNDPSTGKPLHTSLPTNLPSFRDPDGLLYYKPEMGGLVIGGWEANTKEVDVPDNFGPELYEGNMDRFEQHAIAAAHRTPCMETTGIRKLVNGPIPISPDGEPILGLCSEYSNVYVAAGFTAGIGASGGAGKYIAEWVMEGEPSIDLWPLDIRRFNPGVHRSKRWLQMRGVEAYGLYYKLHYPGKEMHSGRNLRQSGAYNQMKEQGAVFGTKFGWERANYFVHKEVDEKASASFASSQPHSTTPSYNRRQSHSSIPDWDYVRYEHLAARETGVIIDQSSFAKLEIFGRDAEAFVSRLANNDVSTPSGSVIYTQMLNERGGIEADVTIARLEKEKYYVITGSGFATRDFTWIRSQLPPNSDIQLNEVTSLYGVLNVAGPNSRKLLEALGVEEDISNEKFPFMTWRTLTLSCGVTVRALRVTFIGELGYELHIPMEQLHLVYAALFAIVDAHPELGIIPAGYRILETLRLEKGYRVWSSDLSPQVTPLEAGLGFCCKWDKTGGFIGEEALKQVKQKGGPTRKLVCFTIEKEESLSNSALGFTHEASDKETQLRLSDPLLLYGNEAIYYKGKVVGYSTSAGFGYSVGKHIVYGFLPTELADSKEALSEDAYQLNAYGTLVSMKKQPMNKALYDPKREKILM